MTENKKLTDLQAAWEQGVEQANQQPGSDAQLGDQLREAAGLHIKSGVQAGGIWGTTSCTCEQTCDCTPP